MAKSFTKKPNITEIPTVGTAVQEPEPPAREPEAAPQAPTTAPPPKIKNKGGRPPANSGLPPKTLTFFQRVNSIPAEDWGTRAKIRTYRLAPIIDRLRGSECKFICIYQEPITEDRLKADHGSGRYRLYLAYKGAGEQGDRELDQVEIDVLDPKFPPNVPAGEWMEDPRNKTWAWAKPPGTPGPNYPIPGINTPYPPPQQPQANPAEILIQGMKAATELRRDVREELTAAAPPPPPAAPAAPQQVDPWAAAERILNMRSENPMVTILQKQIDAMQATMNSTHEKFEALQGKYFEAQLQTLKAQLGEKPKGLVDQAAELAQAADKLKGLFGIKDAAEAAGPIKSKMSGWMELATELVPGIINSPIMNSLAARLMPHANGTAAPPQTINLQPHAAAPTAQQNGSAQGSQQELFEFVNRVVSPALIEYLEAGNPGGDFAEWLYDGFPARVHELQTITHAALPGMQGAQVIIELYKHSPVWTQLQRYPEFPKFVEEFCAWKPEPEEGEPAPASTVSTDEHESTSKGDF